MLKVLGTLSRLAPTELTITLIGETGVGKDVLSQAVHEHSQRSAAPFVVFDCGAVAANLAESELFGHERGAFTGAQASHPGAFERANGGTLFLDEVGELPLDLQPRLLRALENRGVQRVGGTQYRPVDLRVIAATNRDLAALAAEKRFRQDLFLSPGGGGDSGPCATRAPRGSAAAGAAAAASARQARAARDRLRVPSAARTPMAGQRARAQEHFGERLRVRRRRSARASALALHGATCGCDATRPTAARRAQARSARKNGGRADPGAFCWQQGAAAQALGISVSTLYEKLKKFGL